MTDWAEVLAHDFAVPADRPVPELLDELCGMLRSPDPAARDDIVYSVLAIWRGLG